MADPSSKSVRLLSALKQQGVGLRLLEVGCGNGWLSNAMQRAGHHVIGIDPFTAELEQAARVFPNGPVFARIGLLDPLLPCGAFDAIIFAASIHYFNDLERTLNRCFELLRPNGTVHILDTVIYADRESAQSRSTDPSLFQGCRCTGNGPSLSCPCQTGSFGYRVVQDLSGASEIGSTKTAPMRN